MIDITLAILAGGRGERMGTPKALLTVRGQPILANLLSRFVWNGPTMLVTAPGVEIPPGSEHFALCAAIRCPSWVRCGVLTALQSTHTEIVVVTTVDMPELMPTQLTWLAQQLIATPTLHGLMLSRGEQLEPFPSAFRRSAIPGIEQQLAQQRRSMHGLLKLDGFKAIPAPSDWPQDTWTNLNTPEDLRAFLDRT